MLKNRRRVLLAAVPLTLALGACSSYNDDRGIGDAPASQVDDAVVPVWPGPNGFMNIGAYCIGADAVYVHTREAAPVVIADSANCEPGGILEGVRPLDADEIDDAEVVQDGSDGEEE